ncbi:hypothetical protein BW014_20500 [Salmonella enterica]|nr:hypothetical protein [Salmonella enterica subsp. enterica serovar Oranienburg]EBG9726391.1 hypothetical protein [Salmonella enterica]EBW2599185.1 hypothetical protein [Salmonella enterica subsp. enterica serovar Poano]EDU8203246.1 hypothetical protein [Salmonella enterica subsp. diarizonae]ECT8479725.1 hypothetical protein [Salmonella enterica]
MKQRKKIKRQRRSYVVQSQAPAVNEDLLKGISIELTHLSLQMATVQDAAKESAIKRGAVSGAVSGAIAGAVVATAIALIRTRMGL